MARTKAEFRALREMVGLSQADLAEEMGVTTRSVKRWEDDGAEWHNPPQDAWDALDAYLMTQDQMVAEATEEVRATVRDAGRAPDAVAVTYYKSQAQYDALGRDEGCYGIANANARALASALRREGVRVEFRYPDAGAVPTPGSRYGGA